jgi:hypothetical protein
MTSETPPPKTATRAPHGNRCTVCNHPKRNEIDEALITPGISLRDMARQFHLSKDALSRHVKGGHIAEKIQLAKNAHEVIAADNLLTRIKKRYARFEKMAEDAQGFGDPELELKIYREEAKYLELEGKALGTFRENVQHTGNVTLHFDKEDANL